MALQGALLSSYPLRIGEGGYRISGSGKTKSGTLVSVITVVFNGSAYLEETILSVLNQSYENVEYIVIDGGSTDGTLDIIRKYEDRIAYWVSEPDQGIYDAWNKGLSLAKGEWIAFLGADDYYHAGAIDAYMEMIDSCAYVPDYVSSRLLLMNAANASRIWGKRWDWKVFRRKMRIAHVGSMHHKSLFERYGVFDTAYKICGDYEFLLRPGMNLRAAYLEEVTAVMRMHGMSNASSRVFWENARAKTTTGKRNIFASYLEEMVNMAIWKVRNWLKS